MSDDEEIDELEGLGDDPDVDALANVFGNLLRPQREGAINPLAREQNESQMRKNRAREELDVKEDFPSRDPKYQDVVNPAIARLKRDAKRFKRPEKPGNKTMEDTFGVRPKDKDNNDGGGRGIMT